SIEGEPMLIIALVRIACLRIASARVERTLGLTTPRGHLAEVQAELLREAESDLFWYSVRGERAGMDRLFTNLRSGVISLDSPTMSGSGTPESRVGNWLLKPYLPGDHAVFLEIVTKAYEARLLPDHEQREALKQVERDIRSLPPSGFGSRLTRLLTPAFTKIHDASLRIRASLRCAAVGLAVERYRLAHGRWPATLEEIPKDILPAIPLDAFDGKPLKYAKRDDGVTVYSIGLDERDDGGTIPLGKVTNVPGQDIGFRLYDPARRGLPAEPSDEIRVWLDTGEEERFGGAPPELGPDPREVAVK